MNNTTTGNAACGLYYLIHDSPHSLHLENCYDCREVHDDHPFDLPLPSEEAGKRREIISVGAPATDRTVEVFLANIRFWSGGTPESLVKGLRVISLPFRGGQPGQHEVRFEVWIGRMVIISGITTDFSGAGNAARQQLEDVFALLSQTYKVEIMRVKTSQSLTSFKQQLGRAQRN